MEKKDLQTYKFEIKNFKEVYDYCYLNQIMDINSFIDDCFKKGFNIEKYGLLNPNNKVIEKVVEKIVEVPVDREVLVEKIIEKEVPVEKIVYVNNSDDIKDEKIKMLQTTLLNLKKELSSKDEKIKELETKNKSAVFLNGSNLNQRL